MRINIKLESDAFQEDPNYKTYSTLPVIKVHFFFNIFLNQFFFFKKKIIYIYIILFFLERVFIDDDCRKSLCYAS